MKPETRKRKAAETDDGVIKVEAIISMQDLSKDNKAVAV